MDKISFSMRRAFFVNLAGKPNYATTIESMRCFCYVWFWHYGSL